MDSLVFSDGGRLLTGNARRGMHPGVAESGRGGGGERRSFATATMSERPCDSRGSAHALLYCRDCRTTYAADRCSIDEGFRTALYSRARARSFSRESAMDVRTYVRIDGRMPAYALSHRHTSPDRAMGSGRARQPIFLAFHAGGIHSAGDRREENADLIAIINGAVDHSGRTVGAQPLTPRVLSLALSRIDAASHCRN